MKGDFSESERTLTADESFAAELAQSCDSQSSEREDRQKSMAEELLAIHETIKLLNEDDALELFKTPLTFGAGQSKHRCGGQTSDERTSLVFPDAQQLRVQPEVDLRGSQRQECQSLEGHFDDR